MDIVTETYVILRTWSRLSFDWCLSLYCRVVECGWMQVWLCGVDAGDGVRVLIGEMAEAPPLTIQLASSPSLLLQHPPAASSRAASAQTLLPSVFNTNKCTTLRIFFFLISKHFPLSSMEKNHIGIEKLLKTFKYFKRHYE